MKKIISIALLLLLVIGFKNIEAASLDISGATSINTGDKISVTVAINGASDFYGLTSKLTYDSSKLSFDGASGSNGFTATVGSSIVIDNSVGKSGNFALATLTFTAKNTFAVGESTTISLGTADIVDANTTSASGDSLTITVAPPKNSNNNLKSLEVSEGDISFSKTKTSYSINVKYDVNTIKINAQAEDSTAKVSGTGTKNLDIYNNTFKIVVTAEDGNKKTYTITVNREDADGNTKLLSNDTSLSNIEIKNYPIVFTSEISEYTVLLESDETNLEISALASNEFASVTIDTPANYIEGNNIITITVLAENGDSKEYIINAIKLENTAEVIIEKDSTDNNVFYIIISSLVFVILAATIIFIILLKKQIINIKFKK